MYYQQKDLDLMQANVSLLCRLACRFVDLFVRVLYSCLDILKLGQDSDYFLPFRLFEPAFEHLHRMVLRALGMELLFQNRHVLKTQKSKNLNEITQWCFFIKAISIQIASF